VFVAMAFNLIARRKSTTCAPPSAGGGNAPGDPNEYLTINGEPVSQEALKAGIEPAKQRRIVPWLRLMLRYPVWIFVLLVGVPGAILSSSWRVLDAHFSKLNEFLHSDVTSQDDVDYEGYKLRVSKDAYNKGIAVCDNPNAPFNACRSAILSSESSLLDLISREQKLSGAWQTEKTQKSMPERCQRAGNDVYGAWGDYLSVERQMLGLMKAVDPKSQASMGDFNTKVSPLVPVEDAAVTRINNLPPWPKECEGY
jgi:hypothetical protein